MRYRYNIQDVLNNKNPDLMQTTLRNSKGVVISLNNLIAIILDFMQLYPDEYFSADDFIKDEFHGKVADLLEWDLSDTWKELYNPLALGFGLYRPLCWVFDMIEDIIQYESSDGSFCFNDLGNLAHLSFLFDCKNTLIEKHSATQAQKYNSEVLYNVASIMPFGAVDALVNNLATRTTKDTSSLYNDEPYKDDVRISDHWNTKYGKALTDKNVPRNAWCMGVSSDEIDADTGETIWHITDIFGQSILSRSNQDKATICKKLLQIYTDRISKDHKFLHRKYQELMGIRK